KSQCFSPGLVRPFSTRRRRVPGDSWHSVSPSANVTHWNRWLSFAARLARWYLFPHHAPRRGVLEKEIRMSGLVTSSSLKELFKSLLEAAASRQQVEMTEATEFYLVNLLSEFVTVEKLFAPEASGEAEPLAVIYHRALQQDREERIRTLRH